METVVSVMNEEKVGSVLKHFPGYGNNSDTHTGIAYDNRSISTFNAAAPFNLLMFKVREPTSVLKETTLAVYPSAFSS